MGIARTLTLAQQKICILHPSNIGISSETLATITSLRDEQWNEQEERNRQLYGTTKCPFAAVGCRHMKPSCPASIAFVTPDIIDDEEEGYKPLLSCCDEPLELVPIKRVSCLLPIDLTRLSPPKSNTLEIVKALATYELVCDPNISWIPQRVLTIKMQQLMECGLTDIGICTRDAEQIEKYKHIHTLVELLRLSWDELQRFALPPDYGGIPNFGRGAVRDIVACLDRFGFSCPEHTQWIKEQDLPEYIKEENTRLMSRRK